MTRHIIFNADDLGASTGINRGIIEAHTRGVVTSTSLMVDGKAVDEAVELARDHPGLGTGLHWDVLGEDERQFDFSDQQAVRDDFRRQLDRFFALTGKMPTHIGELVSALALPLRRDGRVHYIGGFYAQ